MKKTKLIFTIAAAFFMVSAPWSFTGCDNSDDSTNESAKSDTVAEEDASAEADLLNFTAFRVLRALCSLPTDADTSAGENADSGIELLPEGWQGMTFKSDEGYILDPDNPTVRSVAVAGLDDAKEYVASVIGEEIDGDTYSWSDSALGSLRFKAGSGEDIFATLDVSISLIENLTQIQFVSANYLEDSNKNSENSFSGVPYYAAGDIIRRKSDGLYLICVRPAGGPYKKDNSYWIKLTDVEDSSTTDKERYLKKTYPLPSVSLIDYSDGKIDEIKTKDFEFIYEKNLMSLKTAKAAAHTFHWITITGNSNYFNKCPLVHGLNTLQALATDDLGNTYDDTVRFNFAYESPKTDSVRNKSHPSGITHDRGDIPSKYKKYYTKYALVDKVQPFIRTVSETKLDKLGKLVITMDTKRKQTIVTPDKEIMAGKSQRTAEFLYSLTDTHDPGFLYTIQSLAGEYGVEYNAVNYSLAASSAAVTDSNRLNPRFAALFLTDKYNQNGAKHWMGEEYVIISPEFKIPDNKGSNGEAIKPDTAYEDIFRQADFFNDVPIDYWGSLSRSTHIVDGKTITNWKSEH
ncbi:MAG: hypothetical protein IJ257_07735 [Treponema sp.]|nr:hypothetical protein [Treponema sp.]